MHKGRAHDPVTDWLRALGLGTELTTADITDVNAMTKIKKRRDLLARDLHPDKNPDDQKNAAEKFRNVQQAYDKLKEEHKRRQTQN